MKSRRRSADTDSPLTCRVTPRGRIEVRPDPSADGPRLSTSKALKIVDAFAAGRGHGVLHLGAAEAATTLPAPLGFWRDVGRAFVAGRAQPSLRLMRRAGSRSTRIGCASTRRFRPFLRMQGAELLHARFLEALWSRWRRRSTEEGGTQFQWGRGLSPARGLDLERRGSGLLPPRPEQRDPPIRSPWSRPRPGRLQAGEAAAHPARSRARGVRGIEEPQTGFALLASALTRGGAERARPRARGCGRHVGHPLTWSAHRPTRSCASSIRRAGRLVVRTRTGGPPATRPAPGSPSRWAPRPTTFAWRPCWTSSHRRPERQAPTKRELEQLLPRRMAFVLLKGRWGRGRSRQARSRARALAYRRKPGPDRGSASPKPCGCSRGQVAEHRSQRDDENVRSRRRSSQASGSPRSWRPSDRRGRTGIRTDAGLLRASAVPAHGVQWLSLLRSLELGVPRG